MASGGTDNAITMAFTEARKLSLGFLVFAMLGYCSGSNHTTNVTSKSYSVFEAEVINRVTLGKVQLRLHILRTNSLS